MTPTKNEQYYGLTPTARLRCENPEDESFLFEVYAESRESEFSASGWDRRDWQNFLRMQFRLRQASYRNDYPGADGYIILIEDARAGRMLVHRGPQATRLVDIVLLPAWRNKGLGSSLIRTLQEESARIQTPLRLHVLRSNRALRLYKRLGFKKIGETGFHDDMEWMPEAPPK
jgi:ribosomal protein S18 acetylase RimI-like enzyme